MAYVSLSTRDFNVLEKIKDPESGPSSGVIIDNSLPKDPHISDPAAYERVSRRERELISSLQELEMQLAGLRPRTHEDVVGEYRKRAADLDGLVFEFPDYASARNNRAQVLRRMYGDAVLVRGSSGSPQALLQQVDQDERIAVAEKLLEDLDRAISLLRPSALYSAVSPQAAKALSMAYTQRAAVYHLTAKLLPAAELSVTAGRTEASWTKMEFEERAARDFAMGGRYGNEVAKALAVSTNPTAKLCGQIVREAMKKEYGDGFEA